MSCCAWGKRSRVHVLSVFLFYNSIVRLVMDSGRECREEVTCCSSAWWWSNSRVEWSKQFSWCLLWLGGVDSPSVFSPWIQVSRSELLLFLFTYFSLIYGWLLTNERNSKWAITRSLNCALWNIDIMRKIWFLFFICRVCCFNSPIDQLQD